MEPEDKNIFDPYILGKVLGNGAFGTVQKCKHKINKKFFAIK